jgi:hypothetical protein
MQLIHNSTGGRVPKYWRPPYGDSDNRVRAIAREVFGLKTILWNQEYVLVSSIAGSMLLSVIVIQHRRLESDYGRHNPGSDQRFDESMANGQVFMYITSISPSLTQVSFHRPQNPGSHCPRT